MLNKSLTRRRFLQSLALAASIPSFASTSSTGSAKSTASTPPRPNIILIHPDSWDGRVLGVLGHPAMKRATPNIDRLASRGTLFRNAYCPNPICCPSRAAMWSGLHTWNCAAWNNYKGLEPQAPTAFSRLAGAGYTLASPTGGLGKMDYLSGAHSLMNRLGAWTGPANIELPIMTMAAPKVVDDENPRCHKSDWTLIDRARKFLNAQRAAAAPFFLYLGLAAPHPPFTTNRRYLGLIDRDAVTIPPEDGELHPVMKYQRVTKNWQHGFDRETVLLTRSIYYAMCAEVDAMVGALLDEVDRLGLAGNTYFILASDHGENNMEHRQWYKMNFYESSARVPLVVAGPGVRRGKILDNIVQLVDLCPTLLEMAGLSVPAGLDGESLLPLLTGATEKSRDSAVAMYSDVTANTTMFMLRRGDWKYIAYPGYPPQLFNLKDDPEEIHNLAGARPEAAAALDAELRKIVDYQAVHRRVIAYDKESFRQWREQAQAGEAKGEAQKGKAAPALTYDQGLAQCYQGWTPELDEKLDRWLRGD